MLDVLAIVFDGGADERAGVCVAADEFGGRREGEVEQIVEDEDLAVAVGAGADADGGDGQLGGDFFGDFAGNAFEDERAGAGMGEGECVRLELLDGFGGAGLDAVAAHAMEALRREAEVADDGNLGVGEGADQLDARPFDLDGFRAGFLDEADGVGEALGDGGVVAAEGHVGDDEGAADGAANGAGVVQHLVHGDGEGVVVAEDDHGERVADEEEVDAGFVDQARAGVVVGGERGDGFALALHFAKGGHGDFCAEERRDARDLAARPGKLVMLMVVSSAAPKTQDATRTRRVYALGHG